MDDDLVNRLLARALLEHLGWRVQEAHDGKDALRMIEQNRLAAVLLDISLPDISGIELCRQLRQRREISGLLLVAYTAMAMVSERPQLLAAGFDEILLKPVNIAMLKSVLCSTGSVR